MHTTACILSQTAYVISRCGLHRGDQFADSHTPALDICAAVYLAAEGHIPTAFHHDEDASIRIIKASPTAMAAIKALSDALDSDPCETKDATGLYVPDYIEHVSNWAATASPIAPKQPPTESEVIGRILRAANHALLTTAA
ncbi:DUF6197 family protein [Streptomyces sp. NPDC003395]